MLGVEGNAGVCGRGSEGIGFTGGRRKCDVSGRGEEFAYGDGSLDANLPFCPFIIFPPFIKLMSPSEDGVQSYMATVSSAFTFASK